MSKIFRKSAIGLAVLSLAGVSYAGSTFSGFFGGIEASYLGARNEDLAYVDVPSISATGSYSSTSIPLQNHNWGYRLFGGMKFCGNEDLTLSYLRFHTTDAGFIEDPRSAVPGFVGLSRPRWLFENIWTHINAHVTFNLDDYYAVFGHTVTLSAWQLRFAGGLEYARLDSDMNVQARLVALAGLAPALGYTAKNEVRGFGPRVEFDATYNMPYGLSVFADTNGALLMSRRIISLNTMDALGAPFPVFLPTFNFSTRYPIIPKVGLRLGVGCSHTFGAVGGEGMQAGTTMTLEAGWQAESYIHAIERPQDPARLSAGRPSLAPPAGEPGARDDTTKTSNYGYQGPFITAKISTNWM